METISFDEMSTLDVPSAALRSSLDKIASALQKVGAAGTDASAAVDELRTSLRAAAAQSVKSARSLAKFDEINRLSAPAAEKADAEKTTAAAKKTGGSTRKNGSRSGSRAKAEANGEVSIWQAALQTLRDAWDGFWLYLQTYYGPAIAAWQAAWEQIKQTALAVWEPVRAAALDLWNGALQPLADYLLTVFLPGVTNSFSQAFAPILGGTISAAMTILGNLFVWLCGLIGELVNTVVQPALALLLEIWQGVMDGITAAWQAYGQPILDGLVQAFQGLTDLLTALWQSVLQPVLTGLISLIGTLWSEHLQPLWQQLTMALGAVMNLVLTVWNTVLMPLAAWLVSTLGPVVAQVFNGIASVVGVAIGLVADTVNIGLTILQGLADFLTAVLQGRWSTAWNAMAATVTTVWSKITSTIQSAVNGILSVVRGMVSGIQSAVNGLLSSISDNVFVGTVYINEAKAALEHGAISLPQFEMLAVAINTGTNLPSVATPNGQAAFLFLLTSALAPLIRLSYGRMVWMALPYTIVLTLVGLLCVEFTLMPVTDWLLAHGWLVTPTLP